MRYTFTSPGRKGAPMSRPELVIARARVLMPLVSSSIATFPPRPTLADEGLGGDPRRPEETPGDPKRPELGGTPGLGALVHPRRLSALAIRAVYTCTRTRRG